MRCPDCNKFTGLETEFESIDGESISTDENGFNVTWSATINRNCAECGGLLKQAVFEFEEEEPINWKEHGVSENDIGEAQVEIDDPDVDESGGGRYAKNMITANCAYRVKVGDKVIFEGESVQSMAASEFEEQV